MANYMWNAGAGDFNAAKNWEVSGAVPTQPPGSGDFATFDGAGIVVTGTGTAQRLIFYTAQIEGQLTATYGTAVNQDLTLDESASLTTPRLGIPIDNSQGGGTLTVGKNASVVITPFHTVDNPAIAVGDAALADPEALAGTLLVQGVGAIVNGGNQPIYVGSHGVGLMKISDGGVVTAGNGDCLIYPWALVIGNHATGTVDVSDATLTARGQIIVGRQATGTLTIGGCSVVAAEELYIGWSASGTGSVSISGNRARLFVTGLLDVAAAGGTGSLEVANDAVVSAGIGVVVNGTLTLDGGRIDATALAVNGTLVGAGKVTAPTGFENNAGTIEAQGLLILVGDLSNDGTINVDTGGELQCIGSLIGQGKIGLKTGAVASLAAVASTQAITFAGSSGKLVIRSPADFYGTISGFVKGDTIELDAPATHGTFAAGVVNGVTGGVLTLTDAPGNVVAQLSMIGAYVTTDFKLNPPGVVQHT